jgi:hypothetical protein
MAKQAPKVVTKTKSISVESASSVAAVVQETDSSSIAALAYELWRARGCPEGSPETDWFQAEQELAKKTAKPLSQLTEQHLLTRHVGA